MSKFTLVVHQPLSKSISPVKTEASVLEGEFAIGETLEDLAKRLLDRDNLAWRQVFNADGKAVKPGILTILNGSLVRLSALSHVTLHDGDKVELRLTYAGG